MEHQGLGSAQLLAEVEGVAIEDYVEAVSPIGEVQVTLTQGARIQGVWGIISHTLQEVLSVEPLSQQEDYLNKELHEGRMQAWMIWERSEEKKIVLLACILTHKAYDPFYDSKNLVVAAAYGFKDLSNEVWRVAIEELLEYTRGQKLDALVMFSDVAIVIRNLERMGADVAQRVIRIVVQSEEEED